MQREWRYIDVSGHPEIPRVGGPGVTSALTLFLFVDSLFTLFTLTFFTFFNFGVSFICSLLVRWFKDRNKPVQCAKWSGKLTDESPYWQTVAVDDRLLSFVTTPSP